MSPATPDALPAAAAGSAAPAAPATAAKPAAPAVPATSAPCATLAAPATPAVPADADYGRNRPDEAAPRFEQSLWVLTTVMSRPAGHAVVDAGLKAHAIDSGLPQVALAGWRYAQASDEHGVLVPEPGAAALAWGDKVRLLPGHCDPTVNLHDWLVAVRGDRVEALWAVEARGALG